MTQSQTLCIFPVGNKQTQSPLCSTIQNVLEDHNFPSLLQVKGSQKPSDSLLCGTENISLLQGCRILSTKGGDKAWNIPPIASGQRPSKSWSIHSFPTFLEILTAQSWNANRQIQLCLLYWYTLCHHWGQLAEQSHYLIQWTQSTKSVITSTGFLVVTFEVSVNQNLKRKEREKKENNTQTKKKERKKKGIYWEGCLNRVASS